MSNKHLLPLCLVFAASLALCSCGIDDPVSPVDAELAKGGVPGAPGDDSQEPVELLEYYIFQNEVGENFVHILAAGSFPHVNLNVVQDYIFNGIRDDDYSIFYEYTTNAPLPVGPEDLPEGAVWEFVDDLQAWHVDIPWNGETWYDVYSDDGMTWISRETTSFPDFPHTNLNVNGGDPYAFDVRFQEENGDYIDYYQPQGIILAGVTQSVIEMDLPATDRFHGGAGTIYSYATYTTATAGEPVFIDQIVVDESSIICEVKTISERIDKVKVTRQVTEVSVMAQVVLKGGVGEPLSDAWIDVVLATGSPEEPEFLDSFITTPSPELWANGRGVSTQFENTQTVFQLMLAVPYVYATDLEHHTVYKPSLNNDLAGVWSTFNKGPISTPGTFPYAITVPFTVDCGR